MVQYRVLDVYDSGWRAVRGVDEFFVESPSNRKVKFGSSSVGRNQRRARLFAALCTLVGEVPLFEDPDAVPIGVAAAGKPEIAAYLGAAHGGVLTRTEIANMLGIDRDSVTTYYRRVLEKVEDRKIGGAGR